MLASCQLNELGEAGKTIRKLNTDLYHITITGDAGFELYLAQGGASSTDEMADAMFDAAALPTECDYGGTQWTIVYNQKQGSATYYWRRDRARSYTFFTASSVEVIKE